MVPIGDSGQAATSKVGWRIARMNGANMPVAPAVVAFTLVDVWNRRVSTFVCASGLFYMGGETRHLLAR